MKMNVSASNLRTTVSAVCLLAALATLGVAACSGDSSKQVPSDGQPSGPSTAAHGARSGKRSNAVPTMSQSEALKGATFYVGLRYDSIPSRLQYEGGAVLPRGALGANADYDFAHVKTPRGDMVWLDTIDIRKNKRTPTRIVRAELVIPPLANDERLFMASCDANGKFDSRVIAIVVNEPGATRFTKIRQAWRVSVQTGRFDIIPLAGVTCEDPGS
jgi:hypothetical protein